MSFELNIKYRDSTADMWVAHIWWLNFWAEPSREVDKELAQYNARLAYDRLVFDSEEDAVYFVLRWS